MSTIGLYAGSFDPMTRGHLDILSKAIQTFDTVHVAIGRNVNKSGFLSVDKRLEIMKLAVDEWENPILKLAAQTGKLKFGEYAGISIIAYAKLIGATHIVRGLRQAGDFNDEFALTGIAAYLNDNIIFTHFIGKEKYLHVSSSTARELASLGEDISWLVTPSVEKALEDEFARRQART
jgi:pantetheine-phosphate adenylyltransferase